MKRIFLALVLPLFFVFFFSFPVFAQSPATSAESDLGNQPRSFLPEDNALPSGVTLDCMRFMKNLQASSDFREKVRKGQSASPGPLFLNEKGVPISTTHTINFRDSALSCGIKTGRIELWLAPFYLVRVIDFALLLAGLASVFFIILGSYHMIIGSYTEDKEKGKKTIMYALLGLALSLLSYTIVNLLLLFLTA